MTQAPRASTGDRLEKPLAEPRALFPGDWDPPITNRRQVANLPHKIGAFFMGFRGPTAYPNRLEKPLAAEEDNGLAVGWQAETPAPPSVTDTSG